MLLWVSQVRFNYCIKLNNPREGGREGGRERGLLGFPGDRNEATFSTPIQVVFSSGLLAQIAVNRRNQKQNIICASTCSRTQTKCYNTKKMIQEKLTAWNLTQKGPFFCIKNNKSETTSQKYPCPIFFLSNKENQKISNQPKRPKSPFQTQINSLRLNVILIQPPLLTGSNSFHAEERSSLQMNC